MRLVRGHGAVRVVVVMVMTTNIGSAIPGRGTVHGLARDVVARGGRHRRHCHVTLATTEEDEQKHHKAGQHRLEWHNWPWPRHR